MCKFFLMAKKGKNLTWKFSRTFFSSKRPVLVVQLIWKKNLRKVTFLYFINLAAANHPTNLAIRSVSLQFQTRTRTNAIEYDTKANAAEWSGGVSGHATDKHSEKEAKWPASGMSATNFNIPGHRDLLANTSGHMFHGTGKWWWNHPPGGCSWMILGPLIPCYSIYTGIWGFLNHEDRPRTWRLGFRDFFECFTSRFFPP